MVQAFNGAGDTIDADVDQPLLLLAVPDPAGVDAGRGCWASARPACYWAITIAETVIALVAIVFFRRGTWKTRMV